MELSIFLAKVIGLYFVILSLFVLIRSKVMNEVIQEVTSNPGMMFLMAVVTLILGIMLIVSHNIWVADWRVIITVLGWLIFVGGIVRLFFINSAKKIGEWWSRHRGFMMFMMVVYLIIGLYLLYVSMMR